jgi:hypothetical protein
VQLGCTQEGDKPTQAGVKLGGSDKVTLKDIGAGAKVRLPYFFGGNDDQIS